MRYAMRTIGSVPYRKSLTFRASLFALIFKGPAPDAAFLEQAMSQQSIGPSASDLQFSDFCQKLLAGAMNGQQYVPAWTSLARMFGASSVQLLRDVTMPLDFATDSSPVHGFDRNERHPTLAQALAVSGADHGLLAIARIVPRGFDCILVMRKAQPFSDGERGWMELAVAQIREALELGDHLATPLPTAASAVQLARLFPTPCVLTDEAGRCIERNHAFDRILDALSGAVRGGRVVFSDPFLQDSWQQALVEGRVTAATQSLLANTPTGDQWKVHIVPFACVSNPVQSMPRHLMFAVFEKFARAEAPARTMPSSRPLTKAELEVLASLLLGHTAKTIARTRGASVNTVRSQIATILGKTGHHTQKELMASFSTSSFDSVLTSGNGERR